MSLAEQQDAHADWLESEAARADAQEESQRQELAECWDECLKKRDIDAPIEGGYYGDMIEVLNDACSDSDQTINRELMQALIHCAAKGQVEAAEALGKVKGFFINRTMEFENGK